jgi:homoserine kinase type II
MAVYTDVAADDLAAFLASYGIGELLSYKGIAEGVENSNFLLHTSKGAFILTLYEKRVEARDDLPFFLGLMEHLCARGVNCPQPQKNRDGQVSAHRSPAARRDHQLPRRHVAAPPQRDALRRCRRRAGADACRRARFPMVRKNNLSVDGWRGLLEQARRRAPIRSARAARFLQTELEVHERRALAKRSAGGVIHADLFPDNVFFLGDKLSGLIDFPFACTDMLAYDVAICLNAWCFEPDLSFNPPRARRFAQCL